MAVYTEHSFETYAGDGLRTVFPITFQFFDEADLVVTLVAGGVERRQIMGSNYTVQGGRDRHGIPNLGFLQMREPPPKDVRLIVMRQTQAEPAPAAAINDATN